MPQVKNWVAAFSCLRQMSILMAGCIVKSPNDKKWLSLQRDRRNSYGEGPIASCLFYEWDVKRIETCFLERCNRPFLKS